MSAIFRPGLLKPFQPAIINRTLAGTENLGFWFSANDTEMVPRDAVTGTKATFANGNTNGWTSFTDFRLGERVWQADATVQTNGNWLTWPAFDYYRKSTTSVTVLWRQNVISMPNTFAAGMNADLNGSWQFQNDGTVWIFEITTPLNFQFCYSVPINLGVWNTSVIRWASGGAMRITLFDDDGNILNDSVGGTLTDSFSFDASGLTVFSPNALLGHVGVWNAQLSDAQVSRAIINRNLFTASPTKRTFFIGAPSITKATPTGVTGSGAVGVMSTNKDVSVQAPAIAGTGAVGLLGLSISASPTLTGVGGTGRVGNLSVQVQQIVIETYALTGSFPVTMSLDNLASASAQQSTAINNFLTDYDDVFVRATVVGTSLSNGFVDFYVYGAAEGASFVYTDGATGINGTFSGLPLNSVFLGAVRVTGATTSVSAPMSVASITGGEIPDSWGLIAVNRTQAALGSGNTVVYQGKGYSFTSAAFSSPNQSVSLTGITATGGVGAGNSVTNAAYISPTKAGYTLARDFTFGSTLVTQTDLDSNFYWYAYPNAVLAAPIPPALVGQSYGLVFDDEFNVLDFGTTGSHRWYPYPYTETLPITANISVSNSILNLKWTQGQTNNDTSISTAAYDRSQGQSWYLGYIEALVKWDVVDGAVPQFGGISLNHILGTDIFSGVENFSTFSWLGNGHTATTFKGQSLYETGTSPSYSITDTSTTATITAPVTTDWHKIAMWWTAGQVKFYLDDVLVTTSTTNANTDTHKDAMSLLFGISWDGANGPGTTTINMFVDWVRVWQANASSPFFAQGNDWESLTNATVNRQIHASNLVLTATLPAGTSGFNTSTHLCTPSGQPILSGLAQTIYNQYFGYWEASCLVQRRRSGNPRFYIVPVSGNNPPELVIAEWPNNGTLSTTVSLHPVYHADGSTSTYSNTATGYTTSTDVYSPGFDYALGYHTMGIDWNLNSMTHYVDGVLITSRTFNWVNSTGTDAGPGNAVLIMSIGSTFGGDPVATTDFPQALNVAFLRIWQKNPPPPTTVPVLPPPGNANLWTTQDFTQFTDLGGNTLIGSGVTNSGGPATVLKLRTPAVTPQTTTLSTGQASFTVPTGVTTLAKVECWAGGGGGGGDAAIGGGGGGGAYSAIVNFAVTPGQVIPVSIGAAGAAAPPNNGTDGADTWFSSVSTCLAKGGLGGTSSVTGGAGGAAASGVGTTKFSGGAGGDADNVTFQGAGGGGASASPTGNGGAGLAGTGTASGDGGASPGGGAGGAGALDPGSAGVTAGSGISNANGGGGGGGSFSLSGQSVAGSGGTPGGAGGGENTGTGTPTTAGNGAPGQIRISYSVIQ